MSAKNTFENLREMAKEAKLEMIRLEQALLEGKERLEEWRNVLKEVETHMDRINRQGDDPRG
jgi:uncharacterized protein Yka (UPF0111/DUF47 family)